jgi:hypothetical protein
LSGLPSWASTPHCRALIAAIIEQQPPHSSERLDEWNRHPRYRSRYATELRRVYDSHFEQSFTVEEGDALGLNVTPDALIARILDEAALAPVHTIEPGRRIAA